MLCLAQKCTCITSGSMSTCVCKGACNLLPAQLFIACAVPRTASHAFGLWPCFFLGSAPCLQLPELLQPSPPTSTRMLAQVPCLRAAATLDPLAPACDELAARGMSAL